MAGPDRGRQEAGRRGKASGAAFERALSAACGHYMAEGLARIEKTPEPFHITGKGPDGTVRGYYEGKAQPDFKGVLRGGAGIVFEAKRTESDRIRQGAVTAAQWEALDGYERMGAGCYVMASVGQSGIYRVPWGVWKRMGELFGHKHMDGGDLAPYRVRERGGTLLILEGLVGDGPAGGDGHAGG